MTWWLVIFAWGFFSQTSAADFPVEKASIGAVARTDDVINYRLPLNLRPISYDVTLEPFFEPDFVFNGKVVLAAQAVASDQKIYLHGAELTVQKENVAVFGGARGYNVEDLGYDETKEIYTITLNNTFDVNEAVRIEIEFTGRLNPNNRGFYRANYVDQSGVTRWFGTTQFEPTSARRAFPCFDEPALKATFTIHIIRTPDYHSISNMLLQSTTDLGDGRFQDNFEESVVMSTYLVAFVVSDFLSVSEGSHSVYARKQMIEDGRGDYGLHVGVDILKAMEDFTHINYSLSKMYQVAIPDGWFQAGAMENWGLVTYRERYLLHKDTLSTALEKQYVATIVAHEYAHQWFGNLVSPFWWKYIWLNEGFATYFEYRAAAVVEPSMRLMEQFVVRPHQNAFVSDALETTRPMTHDAGSPQEVSALFDRIAYDKSGAVIRMMENFLTTDVFRDGLTIYLLSKEYDAAVADDLWAGLQAAIDRSQSDVIGNFTVKEIMDTWNLQAGYPVLTVARNAEGYVTFSQERFLLNQNTHDLNETWIIPINYATLDEPNFENTSIMFWLTTKKSEDVLRVDPNSWMIVNKQQTGYYRVNYDERNWRLLTDYFKSTSFSDIHLLNRAQLLDDAFNLARSGRLSYKILFDLLGYLARETDYIPLFSLFRGLTYLDLVFTGSQKYELFQRYIRGLLQTAYASVGIEEKPSDTHTDKLNRIQVLNWVCRLGDEDCQERLHARLSASTPVAPDLQAPVYCNGMQLDKDNQIKWNYLYALYSDNSTEELERGRILVGMACTQSQEQIRRLLLIITNRGGGEEIRSSDRTTLLSAIYTLSTIGLTTTLDFLIENFDDFRTTLPNAASSVLTGIAGRITTPELRGRFEVLAGRFNSTFESAINRARSNIEANLDWNAQYATTINDWLDEYFGVDVSTDSSSTSSSTTATTTTMSSTTIITAPPPDGNSAWMTSKFSLGLVIGCFVTIYMM